MNRILPTIALVLASAVPAVAAPALLPVTGQVRGGDGKPLANVFVQQSGTIASTVTDDQGRYALRLDANGKQALVFSAVGYLSKEVPLPVSGAVTLDPVPTYRPSFVPVPPESVAPQDRRFDTQIGLAYRMRLQSTSFNGRTVTGVANNEVAGDARYRHDNVVLGVMGYRNKVPITIANLPSQPAAAPTVENSQWNLSVGWVFPVLGIEILPQLVYSSYYVVPSNAGTAWTGTPLDFNQTRQGFGGRLEAGTRLGALEVLGLAQLVPYSTSITGLPSTVALADTPWGDLGVTLGYNLLPGLRANLSYDWQSNYGQDTSHVIGLGLSYHPERVAP